LRRFLTSKRSSFYYKYEKYYTHIDTLSSNTTYENEYYLEKKNLYNLPNEEVETPQWVQLEKIDEELENLHWYDKGIFKLYYYEGNTLDSLAAKTKISRNSLFTTIDKIRNILKKKLNE
jgi:DNA-directed RNA polymerase specialized sigma subunit